LRQRDCGSPENLRPGQLCGVVSQQKVLVGGPFILSETARNSTKGVSAQVTGGLGRPLASHFVTARISKGVRDCDSQF